LAPEQTIEFDDLRETKNVVKGSIFVVTENDRRFVGRIGQFVPILPGCGGGKLSRVVTTDGVDKDYAVTGTKDHEWLEAETVKGTDLVEKIDYSYFEALVEKARNAMREVGFI